MYKDLLQSSPLLLLPLIALGLFLAAFAAIVARVMTRTREEIDEAARLPLAAEDRHVR